MTTLTSRARPAERAPNAVPPSAYAAIDPELEGLIAELPSTPEGYISPGQADFLYHLIGLVRPKLVAETGFNAGHSAVVILQAMKRYGAGRLVSFDIGQHTAVDQGEAFVNARFPNRFTLIRGDTKHTLAPHLGDVLDADSDATLDLAIVDGGHDIETARADMVIMEALLRPGGYLWLDDFENTAHRCTGVTIVGREFARQRGNCVRFVTTDRRGILLYQKSF
jgi:predicted O-methyltransferase YrrM